MLDDADKKGSKFKFNTHKPTFTEALTWARQLADAMRYCHDEAILGKSTPTDVMNWDEQVITSDCLIASRRDSMGNGIMRGLTSFGLCN